MDALHAPRHIKDLLVRIGELLHRELREHLIGIYLHGSLAFGCFHPETSDIDVLVVVQERLDVATKRRIARALIAMVRDAPAKGLEMSIVTQASLRDFQHPAPFEFHFSNLWRDRYVTDDVDLAVERTDPDLAAHLMTVRERGVRLVGAPIADVIPPIPLRAYLQSIAADAADASRNLAADPVYGILNLCRVLAFIHHGRITSKAEGGQWAVESLPAVFAPLVQAAREAYVHGQTMPVAQEQRLNAFAAYAMREIG